MKNSIRAFAIALCLFALPVSILCVPLFGAYAAEALKVLGQANPAANTLTTLYTVPASTSTVASTITICNQASSAATFRVAIRPAGAAIAAQHYIAFDTTVPANDTITLTVGITLATTDVVSVQASTTTVSFNIFGSELS